MAAKVTPASVIKTLDKVLLCDEPVQTLLDFIEKFALPIMNRLTAQEFQAMNLTVRQNDKCIIIQQSRTERLVDLVPPIGASISAYASASGKVLFSELPQSLLIDLLDILDFNKMASKTIYTRQAFIKGHNMLCADCTAVKAMYNTLWFIIRHSFTA